MSVALYTNEANENTLNCPYRQGLKRAWADDLPSPLKKQLLSQRCHAALKICSLKGALMKPLQVNSLRDVTPNDENDLSCTKIGQTANQNTPEGDINLTSQTAVQPTSHETDDQAKLRWLQNRMKYPALGMCRR